jgi:hypothetical protein
MVTFEFSAADELVVHVHGLDKLWAIKSSLAIPLAHIKRAEVGVSAGALAALHGSVRLGASVPHVITAGRFYKQGSVAFWDVHHGLHSSITLELAHDEYSHLVIDVEDPADTVRLIEKRLASPHRH